MERHVFEVIVPASATLLLLIITNSLVTSALQP